MAVVVEEIVDVAAQVEGGQVRSLTRAYHVSGLTNANGESAVEAVLAAAGIPSSGGAIVVTAFGRNNTLYAEDYSVEFREDRGGDNGVVRLTYKRREGSADEGDDTPTLRGGTSLKQVSTYKDRAGNNLNIAYTDPEGKTFEQTGSIQVYIPMTTLYGEFTRATNQPGVIVQAYGGYVNAQPWQGGAARTWMCTSATFDLVDDSSAVKVWRFSFTFEYDEETWDNDTTLVYIDPTTGRPPSDVAEGNGMEEQQYYKQRDFNVEFA